jgi:hypothetical protein
VRLTSHGDCEESACSTGGVFDAGARHEKGLGRIRQRLVRRYAPSDYFIISDSEKVIMASAESCGNAAGGNYRVFPLGSLLCG